MSLKRPTLFLFLLFFLFSYYTQAPTYSDTLWYDEAAKEIHQIKELSLENEEHAGRWLKFYPNGQLQVSCTRLGEHYEGDYQQFYEDGALHKQFYYLEQRLHGNYTVYYPDSQIQLFTRYEQGQVEGDWIS